MDHNFKDILHNVNLTEGQISVILNSLDHTLDRWEQIGYHCEEDQKVSTQYIKSWREVLIDSIIIWKRNRTATCRRVDRLITL